MPSKAKHLLDLLGVAPASRLFQHAVEKDLEYGVPLVDVGRGHVGVLFPALRSDF